MHVLRLISDSGEVIREYESEHTWAVDWIRQGADAAALLCRSGRLRIYPSAGMNVEIEAAEVVPA